ncbi:hypothetical protein BST33_02270 [Mycolicibacter minnesotensis]|uniref:Uncharacterized protein n=1 Tax=Mycolicibacter minnesotensis TaxID=1118379 RepID=A0A7I7R5W9_9MYCO|nr:hypothetical protein [Mycolicibacter minnesotensis]ORB03785.1 hypothetical protein BST33_02270 [Mycolicibacter minnesotensis]BBY34053.1 hypothetical protein MMIN_21140 [Mycolicibacter minnesotensis]
MTSRDAEASDADLAEQAVPVVRADEEAPGAEITPGDNADIADVIEQHQGLPSDEDDYDR